MNIGNPKDLDLNLLIALELLVEEGSVTRAAERLSLTQSAMSHRLRRLREYFDDPLLVSASEGLVPTPRALELLGPVRRGLGELRDAVAACAPFDPTTSEREFTVVSPDFCEFDILPRIIERLTLEAPHVRVRLREPWPDALRALEQGDVDLWVGASIGEDRPGLVRRVLGRGSETCLVRRGHPDIADELDLERFISAPHLVVEAEGKDVSHIDLALEALGHKRQIRMRIPHFIGAPFIIARTDLIAVVPSGLAMTAVQILPLRAFELPLDPVAADMAPKITMIWHERFTKDPAHVWCRNVTEECTRASFEAGMATLQR